MSVPSARNQIARRLWGFHGLFRLCGSNQSRRTRGRGRRRRRRGIRSGRSERYEYGFVARVSDANPAVTSSRGCYTRRAIPAAWCRISVSHAPNEFRVRRKGASFPARSSFHATAALSRNEKGSHCADVSGYFYRQR